MLLVHHNDFDGIASAAILAGFYQHQGVKDFRFEPVEHDLRETWLKTALPYRHRPTEKMAIVDFPFHPTADVWFDHHETAFHTKEYREQFNARRDLSYWDPQAPSCASLIFHRLWPFQPNLDRYEELAAAADMIDQARYPTVEAYFKAEQPAIAINHAYPELSIGQKSEVVRRLMRESLQAIYTYLLPVIRPVLARNATALHTYLPKVILPPGNVCITDLAESDLPHLRYAAYMAFPHAKYALTLYRRTDGLAISLGKNPWLTFHEVDLGALARKHGGGGHSYAASISFTNREAGGNPYPVARVALGTLVSEINRLDAKKAA